MPAMISVGMSRWNPSVNILPSPPKPITAPTVTRLIDDTDATRSPASDHRDRQRQLDAEEPADRPCSPWPWPQLTTMGGTAASASATVRTSSATV